MQYSYFKKALILALTILLSFSAKSQTPQNSNHLKIVYFGSSVPYGQGATNLKGYTSLFSDILKNRVSTSGIVWETANISIGGDNTVRVLNRYEKDFLPQKGKYVIFALALGNEGIHEQGQPMFDQFEKNMKILINKARSDGYTPIITNSYTRNDYNEKDYSFIKKMNLLIHQWDVPSINLLGAVDDLSGHWMDGFWSDAAHPNDEGHEEMSYTIVPSLFDALESKKPMPEKVKGSSIKFSKNKSQGKYIAFTPENIVHPFTTSISFKASNPGTLLEINDVAGKGTISINENGQLVYSSAKSGNIAGTTKVNDNKWHQVTITHYYAKGVTMLYSGSTLQGTLDERLITTGINIGGADIPKKVAYKNWLFYRSAMNPDEIAYLAKDSLLKSSLELYAPLDAKKVSVSDPLINLAQSMNTIKETASIGN
ncbi:GDSL-type esterase/lipase family protein [Albibacterium bauzanense]|uniref:Lysophospholipase L1-like esterase n=1 Tax=Albibacterium bauzanense TaxID=653929 RepID=A0A4R1LUX1_9SPHI|nr:GDSL-type esterase/lipase family protein [Albibacterium bauzanense]TCK83158.1 lysophospholipase L1-like esterase [Albibacterium bauzanense]